MSILKYSTRQSDLLQSKSRQADPPTLNSPVQHKIEDAPKNGRIATGHPLVADGNRLDSIEGMINQRRLVGGTPQTEQFIKLVYFLFHFEFRLYKITFILLF